MKRCHLFDVFFLSSQYWVFSAWRWSDLALIAIFENVHIAVDKVYFKEFNSQKSAVCAAKFSFSKYHGDLENYYFLENGQKPSLYTSKNNCQKDISKLKFLITFLGPQNGKNGIGQRKNN